MKLTREQAIDRSIELWTWLKETGAEKEDYFGGTAMERWPRFCCYLCEYQQLKKKGWEGVGDCLDCPYCEQFGSCCAAQAPFERWHNVSMLFYRKKYAALFLEQLKELK